MFSTKSSSNRASRTARVIAVAASAAALAMGAPAVANAAPVTVVPGLPPIQLPELPEVPGVPNAPAPKTKEKPKPETTTPEAPAIPAEPNVKSPTGWVALATDGDHQIYWWKDHKFVKQMPISMGTDKHPTPNGVYHTKEKYRDMYMDSSTYGVPIDSPEGYRTYVEYATRMSWDGIFIHAAPWSVAQQGVSNASHGCINISTENGKWVYDTIGSGTPIVVRGTVGGQYTGD
ncbi:L,D-transpeptidase family protein [Gordonia sp. (in: high G+C Gram-positive bacteria)]|uniref:L,D-transpeptidase n=2 Tax=Gordonia sp. (in: high G+C Gram-positive bacteria) TaxID=84139 RepID=UPI003C76F32D